MNIRDDLSKQVLSLFAIGFAIRLAASVVTTLTTLNPSSQADAVEFGNHAQSIARGITAGDPYQYVSGSVNLYQLLYFPAYVDTYNLWGTFLAPFWLLPGPSGLYARLGNVLLATFAFYNVYLVAQYYKSHQAGVIAVFPLLVYPSHIAVQSTLLRDTIVLFSITSVARILLLPSEGHSRWVYYATAGVLLHVALLLRGDNFVIYLIAITAGVATWAVRSGYVSRYVASVSAALSPLVFILALPTIRTGIDFLARTREVRARGRAAYMSEVVPHNIPELIAFSWIGAAYFLYAPFPWMIQTVADIIISLEGVVSFIFTVAAIWGVQSLSRKDLPVTVGLLAGLSVAVVFYGVGTGNYGTGMRLRQMFLWAIFLLGGIGISEKVEIRQLSR